MSVPLGLYKKDGSPCEYKGYTTGKSQHDTLDEIRTAFQENDIVIFKGMVGSGKSVVGIRLALDQQYGRGVVAVPTKVLSDQYFDDYDGNKYFFELDNHRASIRTLKGRNNFVCPRGSHALAMDKTVAADERNLPCTQDINKTIHETRLSCLMECTSWGFVFPEERDDLRPFMKMSYPGLRHDWFLCGVSDPCPYWRQFDAYPTAACIVMNKDKWRAEVAIGRLPRTPLTVIDEADEFLDSLITTTSISNKTVNRVAEPFLDSADATLRSCASKLYDNWLELALATDPIRVLKSYLRPLLLESEDELDKELFYKVNDLIEFEAQGLLVWEREKDEKKAIINFAMPHPDKLLKSLQDKIGGDWLLMSATLQERSVLQSIYDIDPPVINGETSFPGKLIEVLTATKEERSMFDKSWRKDIADSLTWFKSYRDRAFAVMKQPALEIRHSQRYFSKDEWKRLTVEQDERLHAFITKPEGVFSATKLDRGIDLKGVKTIFIDKYPNPGMDGLALRSIRSRLKKENPNDREETTWWQYYGDMARRDFIQQIGRVLRKEEDVVDFWSPDIKCHQELRNAWNGKIVREVRRI